MSRGDLIDQRTILRRLAELQYRRNQFELEQGGCYRVKGDVIDIFPAESDTNAIRLELFDDELELISELIRSQDGKFVLFHDIRSIRKATM